MARALEYDDADAGPFNAPLLLASVILAWAFVGCIAVLIGLVVRAIL